MAIGNSAGPLDEFPISFELERRHFRSQLFRLGGNSITVRDVTPRNRRDPFTGNDYTDEVRGSAAEIVTISPVDGIFRVARRDSTATGKANCSPRNPSTNRPPRISPRASSRRNAS